MKLLFIMGVLMAQQSFATMPKIEIQGHRGARTVRPENTLAAFKYALENKIEVLEMDLSYTKDHKLVLNHDAVINRNICLDPQGKKITSDIYIHELNLSDIQKYDCGSLINPRFPKQVISPKEKIPTFEEVLKLVHSYEKSLNQKFKLNVEIKVHNEFIQKNSAKMVRELIALTKKYRIYDRTVIQSFDINVIDQARVQDSKIKTAFLIEEKIEVILNQMDLKTASDLIKKYKFNILSPNFKLITKEIVKSLQAQGIQVIPWTVNEAKDWQAMIEMEVDGIISDDPVGLKDYIENKELGEYKPVSRFESVHYIIKSHMKIDGFKSEKKRVVFYTAVGLGLLIIVSVISYNSGKEYRSSSSWKNHSAEVIAILNQTQISIERAETIQRGFIITGKKSFLLPVANAEAEARADLKKLYHFVKDNPAQEKLAKELGQLIDEKFAILNSTLNLALHGSGAAAVKRVSQGDGSQKMAEVRAKFKEILTAEKKILLERSIETEKDFSKASRMVIVGLGLAFFLLGWVTYFLRKEIQRRSVVERALVAAKKKADTASEMKTQFLANISHEIRTPMNGIIGMAKILSETELAPEQKDYVTTIKDSAGNLLSLINELLDLSKIESGKLDLEETYFELRSLIQSTKSILDHAAKSKGLSLAIEVAPEVPNLLIGDPLRVRQILLNLINNSIKFSDQGEVKLKVSKIVEEDSAARIYFEVFDQGIGISNEDKAKLFKSFSQGDSSTTRKFGGTGLGLSIVKQLVEMMDGTVDVESIPGKGSRFFFDLRIKTAKYTVYEAAPKDNIVLAPLGYKILVAEDNITNQKVISALLNKIKCSFKIANNGIETLELLKSEKFDLILMDAQMPLMDGYETTRQIRKGTAGESQRNIPILAATANAVKGDSEKCLEAGMNDYISKPISQEDLYFKISKWMKVGAGAIDLAAIKRLKDLESEENKTIVADVVSIFQNTAEENLKQIKEALVRQDFQELSRLSHHFKSTCINVGAVKMLKILSTLEKANRDDSIEILQNLVDNLEQEYAVATQELEKYEAG